MPAVKPDLVLIRQYTPEDRKALDEMYRRFEPRGAGKGLPPIRQEKTERWLNHIGANAQNLIALSTTEPGRVAGHAILAEGDDRDVELALFVHQDYRERGIGTMLIRASIEAARQKGYKRLWATCSPDNSAIIHMCRKCGFRFLPGKWFPDHELELWL